MIISRDNWHFILGRDLFNNHAGFTFNWGKLPPATFRVDWLQWRIAIRVNIQWPITFRFRSRGAP